VRSLVLDLAVDPGAAVRLADRLPAVAERLRLDDLRRLGPMGVIRTLRGSRFDRCVVIVNDLRAQRRWLSVTFLALVARAHERELMDPSGRTRLLTWASAVTREIPFVARRTLTAARIRRRVRRQVRRLTVAPPRRSVDPKRIVFTRADLSPKLEAGGSLAHIHGVIDGFERLGRPVTFVTPGPVRGLDEDGARVRCVPLDERHRLLPELAYLGYNLDLLPRAIEIASGSRAELVYHRHALGSYAAAAAAQACGLPLVIEYNGPEVWIRENWGDGLAHRGLFEEIERRALRAADLVVAVSEPLREHLRRAGVQGDRILVNPNGVDAERFDPERFRSRREEIRKRLGIDPEGLLVGFVGTFGPWHGAEVLAEAIPRVPTRWSQRMRFLFIGDGSTRARCEAILHEAGVHSRAIFAGLVPQEDTPELLAACDLCVSPHVPNEDGSPFFGSPTKLFEYLASGRAVVASDLGQIGEVLEHDRNAWLVPPGDPGLLTDALVRLAYHQRHGIVAHRRALVINLVDRFRVPQQTMDGFLQVDAGAIAHRLARIDTLHYRELVTVSPHQPGEANQYLLALGGVQAAPAAVVEGFARLFYREVDILRVTGGYFSNGLAGRRVDRWEGLSRLRGLKPAVDEGVARQAEVSRDGLVFGVGEYLGHCPLPSLSSA